PDRRVVLLSDLRDGNAGPPLEGDDEVTLWAPLEGLAGGASGDCAVLGATRTSARAEVRVACAKGDADASPSTGRAIHIRAAGETSARATLPLPASVEVATYTLDLPPIGDEVVLLAEIEGE